MKTAASLFDGQLIEHGGSRGAEVPRIWPTALRTTRFAQGELPWRTEFGSLLHLLRHQKSDSVLQELARVYVVDALKRWEPRVRVTSVQVRERQNGENVLVVRLRYDLTSGPGNNVLVENVEQTVHV